MADVACRWSIRPEHLSRIAADTDRDAKWDDLARALPPLSPNDRAAVTAARHVLAPAPKRNRKSSTEQPVKPDATIASACPPATNAFSWTHEDPEGEDDEFAGASTDGFRWKAYLGRGSELVVDRAIENFAGDGVILVVIATRVGVDSAGGAQEEYQCEAPDGAQRWFEPEEIDDWLIFNGKVRDLR